jgi:hypothetical protein
MKSCSCRRRWRQNLRTAAEDSGSYNAGCRKITRAILVALLIVDLTACATVSRHQFAEPARDWQARSGQLLYRTQKTTLIGEVLVRFSKNGDFELTFSKGPGVTLLVLRQDTNFAEVKGPLARQGWSGRIDRAPPQLRGWLGLRDEFLRAKDRQPRNNRGSRTVSESIRHVAGLETFLLRF